MRSVFSNTLTGLIILVLLVSSLPFVSAFSITGKVVEMSPGEMVVTEEQIEPLCTDSDGGKNYYVKGTVISEDGTSFTDYCLGNKLHETYCGPYYSGEWYTCPYGCSNGACKSGITALSPNGGEKWEVGKTYKITWSSSVVKRVKITLEALYGWDIPSYAVDIVSLQYNPGYYYWTIPSSTGTGNNFKIRVSDLQNSEVFDESDDYFSIVSATTAACTDSDGGKNYYLKGAARDSFGTERTDVCQIDLATNNPTGVLFEAFCDEESSAQPIVNYIEYICPYGCEDGACIRKGIHVEIISPYDGEEVSGTVLFKARATSNYKMEGMTLEILPECEGGECPIEAIFLRDCAVGASQPACEEGKPCPPPEYSIHCTHDWDTSHYKNMDVILSVSVKDSAGNTGSDSVNVYVVPEAGINVEILSPRDGKEVSGIVPFKAKAVSNYKMEGMTLFIDPVCKDVSTCPASQAISLRDCAVGAYQPACEEGKPCPPPEYSIHCTHDWDTSHYKNTDVILSVSVKDSAENTGKDSVSVHVVSETGIHVEVKSPTDGEKVSGTVLFKAAAISNYEMKGMILEIEPACEGGECLIEAIFLKDCAVGISHPLCEVDKPCPPPEYSIHCTYNWDSSSYKNEKVRLTARVTDSAGNTGSDSVNVYVIAEEKLVIKILNPKNFETVSGIVTVRAEAKGENPLGDMYLDIMPQVTPPCEEPPCPTPGAERIKFEKCEYGVPACKIGEPCKPVYTMHCVHNWDASPYKNEWITLRASIRDKNNNTANDAVRVYVGSPKPVCDKIGTEQEGWYLNGELVRYDKCSCHAVCSMIGTESEGWYSSCTKELIKYEKCSIEGGIQITLKNKTIEIKQKPLEGVVEIASEEGKAITKEKLIIREESLEISTSEGAKEVRFLPEEVETKVLELEELDSVIRIEIKQVKGKPIYELTGKKRDYFLWIFPFDVEKTIKIDAETNEVIE